MIHHVSWGAHSGSVRMHSVRRSDANTIAQSEFRAFYLSHSDTSRSFLPYLRNDATMPSSSQHDCMVPALAKAVEPMAQQGPLIRDTLIPTPSREPRVSGFVFKP